MERGKNVLLHQHQGVRMETAMPQQKLHDETFGPGIHRTPRRLGHPLDQIWSLTTKVTGIYRRLWCLPLTKPGRESAAAPGFRAAWPEPRQE